MRKSKVIKSLETWNGMSCYGFTSRNYQKQNTTLSEVLQSNVDPKYYLSSRACSGILNRAAARGKELPEVLKKALERQALSA